MSDLITLVLPRGEETMGYPISHGEESFRPYMADPNDPATDWLVDVPRDKAVHFLHKGGFFLMPQLPLSPMSTESVRLRPSDGRADAGCGVNGVQYAGNPDGTVDVPGEHVAILVEAFGYRQLTPNEMAASDAATAAHAKDAKDAVGAKTIISDARHIIEEATHIEDAEPRRGRPPKS